MTRDRAVAEIQTALSSFIKAFNTLDWEQFRSCFTENATVFHPDNPETRDLGRLEGTDQIEQSFGLVFDAARRQASGPPYLHIEPKNVRVQLLLNAAVVTFEFDRAQASLGRRTVVLEKRSGDWKIVHFHASNLSL